MNNHKMTPRNIRKHFFTFILVISAVIVILLVIIFSVKKVNSKNKQVNKENNSTTDELSEPNLISLEDTKKCPYLNETELTTHEAKRKYGQLTLHEKELPQWRQIPAEFIVSGWKKGYHWHDILQLWEWKLSPTEIPDLKAQQRVGVVNSLIWFGSIPSHILEDETISKEEKIRIFKEDRFGFTKDLVVIVRKITGGGPEIILDKGISGTSPFGNTQKYARKLINFTLNQENLNPNQYEIFLLSCIGTEQSESFFAYNSTGKSFGSAIYLALLSALHQKPIAKSVAATGVINTSNKERKAKVNQQEINLVPGDNLPIAGLKGKSYAAVEKGIDRLVLSSYNTSPNLLGQTHKTDYYIGDKHVTEKWGWAEDYSKVVPPEIRAKITVFWNKNISELRELILGGKLSWWI